MAKVQMVQTLTVKDAHGRTILNYLPQENEFRISNRTFQADDVEELIEAIRAVANVLRQAEATKAKDAAGGRGGQQS